MQSNPVFYAMALLANEKERSPSRPESKPEKLNYLSLKIKSVLFDITKKIAYLSLATVFTSSVSAIETDAIFPSPSITCPSVKDYNCPVEPMAETDFGRHSNFSTDPPALWTFDYDQSLLPEVAEVIFALRIKHVNIGGPLVINLSGNYLLKFTKRAIYILDTYTKSRTVYEYQSINPNITIGLGVSKGLPRNYKSIVIKEDAHGKLYDYAALHSDNMSTDETILSETLSHPFYQIFGKDGVENEVKITKAMAFYQTLLSHSRHARCVKESKSILQQLQDILWPGNGVCEPKPNSTIFVANHQTVKQMTLEEKLVEATLDKEKYKYALGYELEFNVDFKGKNAIAALASALYCHKSIKDILKRYRHRRAPGAEDCVRWSNRLLRLFMILRLDFNHVIEIVQRVRAGGGLIASFFNDGRYPTNSDDLINEIITIISEHNGAERVLLSGSSITGMAVARDPGFLRDAQGAAASPVAVQGAVAEGKWGMYRLRRGGLTAIPNQVRIINNQGRIQVQAGEEYTTHTISTANLNNAAWENIESYINTLEEWRDVLIRLLTHDDSLNDENRARINSYLSIGRDLHLRLSAIASGQHRAQFHYLINTVYNNGALLGISYGIFNNREYQTLLQLYPPETGLSQIGSYRGALAYLESEVVSNLFANNLIDSAVLNLITRNGIAVIEENIFGAKPVKKPHDDL